MPLARTEAHGDPVAWMTGKASTDFPASAEESGIGGRLQVGDQPCLPEEAFLLLTLSPESGLPHMFPKPFKKFSGCFIISVCTCLIILSCKFFLTFTGILVLYMVIHYLNKSDRGPPKYMSPSQAP